MPHAAGRKSRCRLVTTITYRSSHIPTLTTIEIEPEHQHVPAGPAGIQRSCGDQAVAQDQQPVGVRVRRRTAGSCRIMNCSYGLPPYQAMNASIT